MNGNGMIREKDSGNWKSEFRFPFPERIPELFRFGILKNPFRKPENFRYASETGKFVFKNVHCYDWND